MPENHPYTFKTPSERAELKEKSDADCAVEMRNCVIPRLCLNMIVKNESKIIHRLLNSVAALIDTYCICDTGSTDNTMEIIESFFREKKIPGKMVQEPFRDFGYNRTFALKACESVPAEYILLLDADMVLWKNPNISPEEFKQSLIDDAYYVLQGSDTYYYKNIRIVKNNVGFTYWGVTHEYVNFPKDKGKLITTQVQKPVLFINDIGDGGAKTDKFLRDIRLLEKGLEELPNNDRYLFYLANSYKDSGQMEKAIETYKKRIEVGGWIEEIWYSYYCIGKCWKHLGDMDRAIAAWMHGFQEYPNRIENLYEIVQHYRIIGKNQLSYWFYTIADRMRREHPEREYLFMQKDIYDYRLDYELSILGYYVNLDNHNLSKVAMKVLADPNVPNHTMTNVFSNYKFRSLKCISLANSCPFYNNLLDVLQTIGKTTLNSNPGFFSSTPSFCFINHNQLFVNVRLVNYWIKEDGGYDNPGSVHTINVIALLENSFSGEHEGVVDSDDEDVAPWESKTWKIVREGVLEYDTSVDNYYIGLEDVRLSYDASREVVFYNANRGVDKGMMVVEHGIIDLDDFSTSCDVFLEIDYQREIEKNWVLFPDGKTSTWSKDRIHSGTTRMIYGWSPLVIGNVQNVNTSETPSPVFRKISEDTSVPPFFRHIRGSTNGIYMPEYNETWFVCHLVSYEDRRYYYHIIIRLDADTGKVKKYTQLFTLEGQKVEYILGFDRIWPDTFLIGYSLLDKETKYMTLSKESILSSYMDV